MTLLVKINYFFISLDKLDISFLSDVVFITRFKQLEKNCNCGWLIYNIIWFNWLALLVGHIL